jgi:large subunit ribosomal protein L4
MNMLKKYNIEGNELGTVSIDSSLGEVTTNSQLIKDYIVALRANARQWSANTKGRSEVAHTTKKPFKQKGTGNARQGCLVAPQYRGGGVVFGPKPKFDQHVRINQKEKKAAILCLISEKIRENRIIVLESSKVDNPKTKVVVNFLDKCGLSGKKVLFLGEGKYEEVTTGDRTTRVNVTTKEHGSLSRSLRNIPRVNFSLAKNISGYDVIHADDLVITEAALSEIQEWLCGAKK